MNAVFESDFLADRATECIARGRRLVTGAYDTATLATVGFMGQLVEDGKLTADSLEGHIDGLAGSGLLSDARAADARYYEGDLTGTLRDEPFVVPKRENVLLRDIPAINEDPGQRFVTIRYVDHEENAALMRSDSTEPPMVGVARKEIKGREMHWFWTGVPEEWLLARRDAFAGRSNQAEMNDAGASSLNRLLNRFLLKADDGVDFYGLQGGAQQLPIMTGKSEIAKVSTASGDDVLAALEKALSKVAEESDATMPELDTLFAGRALWNAMHQKKNFDAGGSGTIRQAIAETLGAYGVTQVRIADELKNFAGPKTGAIVLMSRASPLSIRHIVGMRPAPIHSYTGPKGEVVVMAACSGGLVAPFRQAGYIETFNL